MELAKAIGLLTPASRRFDHISAWADLGCGSGLFTRALAALLPQASTVYAVDRDKMGLDALKPFGQVSLKKIAADFIYDPLPFTGLDGILMANSLHFVPDKPAFLRKALSWLKEDGCFLLVEYDTEKPDPWLPYPLSYVSAGSLFAPYGFTISKLGSRPSVFKRSRIYAALLERNDTNR